MPETRVHIDYPRTDETVTTPHYTFRISAPAGSDVEGVEVSVDGNNYRPCRYSGGYWWFDWTDYDSRPHRVVAKLQSMSGEAMGEDTRDFVVSLEDDRRRRLGAFSREGA